MCDRHRVQHVPQRLAEQLVSELQTSDQTSPFDERIKGLNQARKQVKGMNNELSLIEQKTILRMYMSVYRRGSA